MSYRINIRDETNAVVGWFDIDAARRVGTDMDRNGNGSEGNGRGQAIWRTKSGRWVLQHWTNWDYQRGRFEYIDADQAREWLLRNGDDEAVAEFFGPLAVEDRRPGRPEIGGAVHVRLGGQLAAVDAYAANHGVTRAQAVRRLVEDTLKAEHRARE